MSVLEVVLTAGMLANVVLNGVVLFLLRDALHTRTMRESVRRLWAKVEREELGQ